MRESTARLRPLPAHYWRLKPIQWWIVDVHDWLFPLMAINLLWLLLSLTVILLPPASAALHDVAYAAYRGIAPTPRAFIGHVRRRFWQGWRWGIANLLVFGALFALGRRASVSGADGEVWLAAIAAVGALVVMAQFYFWPYVAVQTQPDLRRALRNSVFTALGDLMYLTLYLAITGVVLIPALVLIAPVLIIAPTLLIMLVTYSLVGWLQHHDILGAEARDL